jgi:hypothetical protein
LLLGAENRPFMIRQQGIASIRCPLPSQATQNPENLCEGELILRQPGNFGRSQFAGLGLGFSGLGGRRCRQSV